MSILMVNNEDKAREAWQKLFERDPMQDEEDQILAVIPAQPARHQVRIQSAPRPRVQKPRKGYLFRQMGRSTTR